MNSINKDVQNLHAAYCNAMALDLPMTMTFESWWLNAIHQGITPDDVSICIKARLKFNAQGGYKRGLELRHLIRSDEDIAVMQNEVAVLKAAQRIKVMEPAKAQVLRQAGRSDAVATPDAVKVDAIPLLDALRRAAQ